MAQAVFSHLHKAILSCLFSDSGCFFLPLSLLNILLFRHVVGRRHCCCKEQYNKTDWICWVVAGYGHRPVIFVVDGIKEFFFVNNKKIRPFGVLGQISILRLLIQIILLLFFFVSSLLSVITNDIHPPKEERLYALLFSLRK